MPHTPRPLVLAWLLLVLTSVLGATPTPAADDMLLYVPALSQPKDRAIIFTTEGSSFSPVITVTGTPTILWRWADGTTSNEAAPTKTYGSPATRQNSLVVEPWSAVRRINIGYDGGDGGSPDIEFVADQHVSSVRGLSLVAATLAQWCSSYNALQSLDFSNFINLDTIECFLSQQLARVTLRNTPKLRRACFEDCNLAALDLSESPLLEDLRGAVNAYPTINFGTIGEHVWHICVRDNPQLTNQALFADMTRFPNIAELFIWNDNQSGTLRLPASSPNGLSLLADDNHYTALDLSGALTGSAANSTVSLRNNALSAVDITGCAQITALHLENNALPSGQLDTLLATLDALGRSTDDPDAGFIVDIRGNADPGPVGYGHAERLAAKGWTVAATSWTLYPAGPADNGEQRLAFTTTGDDASLRCDFLNTATAVWQWSDGTTTAAVSGAAASRSGLGPGGHTHGLVLSNGAALTRFGGASAGGGNLVSLAGFENFPGMRLLYAYQEGHLTSVGRTDATRIKEYHLMETALSAAAMDQLFADAVATGVSNGTLWGANTGTAASDADRATLLERGWAVY